MPVKMSVIGCGYLGAVHAASMAHLGHEVVGVDTDAHKIAALSKGQAPFFEQGLNDLLAEGHSNGRLRFTTDMTEATGAQAHFVCVGTPQTETGAVDLHYVDAAFNSILGIIGADENPVIIGKSTVPVGTAEKLAPLVKAAGATLVWNPEFLRESMAVQDTLAPDRIVYGSDGGDAYQLLDEIYGPILKTGTPRIITDYATAELVKTAANAFLATKISFINAMAEIADASGADVTTLAEAIGLDERIGPKFLRAGIGFGGGCLPKDVRGLQVRAQELGVGLEFLGNVDQLNRRQRERAVAKLDQALPAGVAGETITILGGAFKPDTDDIRDSPALEVAQKFHDMGATIRIFDPAAGQNIRANYPHFEVGMDVSDALDGAAAVALVTEWQEFKELNPHQLAALLKNKIILDGRNCLDPQRWKDAGFTYLGMGRA